ncbi:MAG: putative zinc-binding metallopeptidase [Pseudomonadota bacterium]
MKIFKCECGSQLYFDNTKCLSCNKKLAYNFSTDSIDTLTVSDDHRYYNSNNEEVKLCYNYNIHGVCNASLANDDGSGLCISCQLNRTIPNLENKKNVEKWAKLEKAKRRLIRTLLQLNLPVESFTKNNNGLGFDFLEDQQQNPNVFNEFVATGHYLGVITINLAETDDIYVENAKNELGEQYRTLLGHLRHESGHYYYDLLVKNTNWLKPFRNLFGNEEIDYQNALKNYYQTKPHENWNDQYISEYSMVHPLEDWAECWAHYLHMVDTLETARSLNILKDRHNKSIDTQLSDWSNLTIALNELNRSMGLNDAYPFVLSQTVIKKIHLVDQIIGPNFATIPKVEVG